MTGADESSSPATANSGAATLLLQRVVDGESSAAEQLLPLVYEQLRAIAGTYFRSSRPDQTLQPTALVHEAYLRLIKPDANCGASYRGREHFLAVASTAMRQILADRARRRGAQKRGGEFDRVTLDGLNVASCQTVIDVVALDDALTRLAAADPRGARIVELRFFGGFTNEQIARMLNLSTRMIEKNWRRTRAWLGAQLAPEAAL